MRTSCWAQVVTLHLPWQPPRLYPPPLQNALPALRKTRWMQQKVAELFPQYMQQAGLLMRPSQSLMTGVCIAMALTFRKKLKVREDNV